MHRGPTVEVNLDNLAYNVRFIRSEVGHRQIIAVVKADAYGHGSVEVSRVLVREGVDALAVAYIREALELRDAGFSIPIIVLFDQEPSREIVASKLTPVVNNIRFAGELSRLSLEYNNPIDVHINVDTGMGRLGLNYREAIGEFREILTLEGLNPAGVMSHFSEAGIADRTYAMLQIERFLSVKEGIERLGVRPVFHFANSAAVTRLPEAYLDAVRPGLMLYGCNPYSSHRVKPVMRVSSRLLDIRRVGKGTPLSYGRTFITKRDSLIGVLSTGYADGYFRSLSNNAEVLVRGGRAPVVGRVCMDIALVDVTDIEGVSPDDEVVLIGTQKGEVMSVEEVAEKASTIPYEVFTSLGIRGRRRYVGGA
ncbi:alanine racemase [bacterium BMS3Bbin06]|nr:alanine racemase [bacterium BMS3Abin08]GBE35079.1 alanine racemase [bacterium BMS3Bbin06]HDO34707.1 alanine racemase [Nitrospirota bacterium]HDY70547.1 alanine racemase [Nitrospirota bacterium]